jgi:uncharacterized protein (TIGR00730 family)
VRRVCVFCGASSGRQTAYAEAARAFGAAVASRGFGLVFGGGRVGLMGALADGALAEGGEVVGVIPQALVARELAHAGVTELHVVGSLHERKALMAELADAFVALPGGFGTLDELMEQLTWSQLGLHAKPVAILEVAGYWRPLIALARHATAEGFSGSPISRQSPSATSRKRSSTASSSWSAKSARRRGGRRRRRHSTRPRTAVSDTRRVPAQYRIVEPCSGSLWMTRRCFGAVSDTGRVRPGRGRGGR